MRGGVWYGRVGLGLSGAVLAAVIALGAAQAKEPPKSVWEQETLTGDWGGARTALKDRGLDVSFNYTGEMFSLLSGGINRRSVYGGLLEFLVDADLQKLIGWNGAKAQVLVFQIQNTKGGITEATGSISAPSNIDALQTTRLFSAWFEQSFGSVAWLRIGQLAADSEFFVSETAGGLINGTFAWADHLSANMLNGGPVYPLAVPGVRIKLAPADNIAVLAAVFSGDPAGPNCGGENDTPQKCNRHGTAAFGLDGGALWIGELQYAVNQGKHAMGLPGVYKMGGWYATADFPDQHFGIDDTGSVVSLGVDPTADPIEHKGNWGIYALADQMVWRQGDRSMNLFVRTGFSPSDRNLLTWYIDGGAGFKGLVPGRPDDVLTFGVAYAEIGGDAADADADALAFYGPPGFIRNYEMVFEVNYALQLAPWWIVKPDFQYIVHPGGNVAHPDNPAVAVKDAAIFGVRSTFTF